MDEQQTKNDTPRIYVASLADYTTGRLLGRWIDADQPLEAIQAEISAMLAESHELVAEEWAIHDYENFGGLRLSEFEGLDSVAQAAALIVEHGPVFAELLSHFGGTVGLDEARRYMEERYQGCFDSVADYAEHCIDECYSDTLKGLPDFIRYHIDYDGIGRDMEYGGDIFSIECDRKIYILGANL